MMIDRRCPAVDRQPGGVKIQAPQPGMIDYGFAELLPERHHDHRIRIRQRFAIDVFSLEHGQAVLNRPMGDGGRRQLPSPSSGAVRLRHDLRDAVSRTRQRPQRRQAERAASIRPRYSPGSGQVDRPPTRR